MLHENIYFFISFVLSNETQFGENLVGRGKFLNVVDQVPQLKLVIIYDDG